LESAICSVNKISISEAEKQTYNIGSLNSFDFATYFDDLKLASKKDLSKMFSWLKKLKIANSNTASNLETVKESQPSEDEEMNLEDEVKILERKKKKRDKKANEKAKKLVSLEEPISDDLGADEWFANNVISHIIKEENLGSLQLSSKL
jgi:hypothetical protein